MELVFKPTCLINFNVAAFPLIIALSAFLNLRMANQLVPLNSIQTIRQHQKSVEPLNDEPVFSKAEPACVIDQSETLLWDGMAIVR